jgi:hypothetical protein
MPRFHLHIRQGAQWLPDEDGIEARDVDAAVEEGIRGARSSIAWDVLAGEPIVMEGYIAVEDAAGKEVRRVLFSEAVTFR